jgi:hypothetical protein
MSRAFMARGATEGRAGSALGFGRPSTRAGRSGFRTRRSVRRQSGLSPSGLPGAFGR